MRVKDPIGGVLIKVARLAQSRNLTARPQEIGQALNPWLGDDPKKWPLLVRNPIREGDVSILPLRLGLQDKIGVIVAGAQRADFPGDRETASEDSGESGGDRAARGTLLTTNCRG